MLGSAPVRCASLLLAPLTLVCLASGQSTWYVDDDAAPPGNGTLASPYASIAFAVMQPTTLAGDLVLVAPGTYEGGFTIAKTITVRSTAGPLATVIQATQGDYGVILSDSASATIEGFSIVGDSSPEGTSGVFFLKGFVKRCILRGHHGGTWNYGFGIDAEFVEQDGFSAVQLCTAADNDVGLWGPAFGVFRVDSSIAFANGTMDAGSIDAQYTTCGTGGGTGGINNNVKGDPLFWSLDPIDMYLTPDSHCIDSGNPGFPLDPDGSRADRGAIPFDATHGPSVLTYCTGKINSQGCAASIGSNGGTGASWSSPTPFDVTCSGVVESVPGLMFWGYAPRAAPFLGGFHCVKPPTPRTAAQFAGSTGRPCSGSFSFDFNAYVQSLSGSALQPGAVVWAQYWYRDPNDLQGFGSATSDAIAFPLAP
jgi:hypothetical protein